MTEGWGMVAAAAVALIGVFSGLFIGRRQVRDQAQVEHGQWLRGQRQEAFVALIAAWDEVIPKFEAHVLDDDQAEYIDRMDAWDEAGMSMAATLEKERAPLRRAAERVQMLGPEQVDQAVAAMLTAAEQLTVGIMRQYPSSGPGTLDVYWEAQGEVDARRESFLAAARDALRQTPDTKRG